MSSTIRSGGFSIASRMPSGPWPTTRTSNPTLSSTSLICIAWVLLSSTSSTVGINGSPFPAITQQQDRRGDLFQGQYELGGVEGDTRTGHSKYNGRRLILG